MQQMLLLLCVACLAQPVAARQLPAATQATSDTAPPIRIFFTADAHSRPAALRRLVEDANLYRPHVVLDGGDLVHDGTEPEFRRAREQLAQLEVPWHGVRGNHDAVLRGPFAGAAPSHPPFAVVDVHGWRVILLDNHDGTLADTQFQQLEAELLRRALPTVVVMHVPPWLGREPGLARLRHVLPYRLAEPTMTDPEQVARFRELMARHSVAAILAGHAHRFDHTVDRGVHYIVAGPLGGLTPGFGIPNEYLDITIERGVLGVRRAEVRRASYGPVGLIGRAFTFYSELNAFNHRELGWTYVPSVSVQFRAGAVLLDLPDDDVTVGTVSLPFERLRNGHGRSGFLGEAGVLGGSGTVAPFLTGGFRVRTLGSFQQSLYLGTGVTGVAGLIDGDAAAAVGVQLNAGLEWRHLTLQAGHGWFTGFRATSVSLGYRY
jgi:predicted phosphodiesterase